MADIGGTLPQIRNLFQRAGEADVMPFIEGTAFLLLLLHLEQKPDYSDDWKQQHLGYFDERLERYQPPQREYPEIANALRTTVYPNDPSQSSLLPTPPTRLNTEQLEEALNQLYTLCQEHRPADIFNRHLLTDTLDSMLPGGRYPTPRHLVEQMARLVHPAASERVADLACGSGSMLVAAHALAAGSHVTGFDISGSWARLAWVNLALHDVDLSISRIIPQNALSGEHQAAEENLYHALLVNPPFGNKEDKGRVQQALGKTSSATSSEVVFTELAIRRLRPDGRAMTLIPTGVLFRNSTAERELHQRLLDECTLHAVITYPADAFQPYSALRTHALRFDKSSPAPDHAIWLFLVEHDGRVGVKNRTDNESEPNQLALVDAALLQTEAAIAITDSTGVPYGELCYFLVSGVIDSYHGRCVGGYRLVVTVHSAVLQLHTFRSSTEAEQIYWATLQRTEDDQSRREQLLIVKWPDDAPVYWQPMVTQPAITDWSVAEETTFAEPFWTAKINDDGSEAKSWLRLLPSHDDGGWQLTSNNDQQTAKAEFSEFSVDSPPTLITNLAGEILAIGSLSLDDPVGKALEVSKAIRIHVPSSQSIGYLWHLDYLDPAQENSEHEARGYLLCFTEAVDQLYAATDGQTHILLAELRTPDNQPSGILLATLQDGTVTHIQIRQDLAQSWQAPTDRLPRGICFDEEGQVIGLQLPKAAMVTPGSTSTQPTYDLQPTTYLVRDSGTDTLEPPARILGRIKRHQHDLTQRIDFLLGIIEQPSSGSALPQFSETNLQEEWLDPRQLKIWHAIQAYLTNGHDSGGEQVEETLAQEIVEQKTLFTPDLLFPDPQSAPEQGTIERTLELLVAMGEIVPVYVQNGFFYRRVTDQDIKEPNQNGVDEPT